MRKIVYLLVCLLGTMAMKAQNPSFVPATFTAEDAITLTIDVTGTPMAGEPEAYLWMWGNAGDSPLNTAWGNSPAAAKMTAAGTNKWSFTFTATVLWGLPPAQLNFFSFLVKKKDGSKQTSNYENFRFDPLVFVPTMLRIFPAKVGSDDVVTVNFDRSLGTNANEQRMTPTTATITMFDETGAQVGSPLTINARAFAPDIWAASFLPSASFTPGAGHTLKKFRYKFTGTALDTGGLPITVTTAEAEAELTVMK